MGEKILSWEMTTDNSKSITWCKKVDMEEKISNQKRREGGLKNSLSKAGCEKMNVDGKILGQ